MSAAPVVQLPIPKRDLLKVLLLDDEEPSADSLRGTLEGLGCNVDVAYTTRDALDFLGKSTYQMVVSDVVFEQEPKEGDDFVIDNEALMGGASRILYTGKGPASIRRWDELKKRGIAVIEKGEPSFFDTLESVTTERLNQQVDYITERIQEIVSSADEELKEVTYPSSAGNLLIKTQQILLDSLKHKKNADKKGIYLKGVAYSPNMLIEEIEKGTDVGRMYLDMFVDLIKYNLGV